MSVEHVNYLGNLVPIYPFRVFIYDKDNKPKLVNSWDEFQEHMATGLWFAEKQKAEVKTKSRKK